MCGIVAIIKKNGKVDENELLKMKEILRHRGPDDEGSFISEDGKVGFAHVRLSIIDLTPTGKQPMASHNERYVMVFNGEIYNYLEIKNKLRKETKFRGTSDSEVLLEFFARLGTGIFDKLNGMWALLIYDKKKQKVYVARDRYGIKPLYYMETQDSLVFASEIKAILSYSDHTLDVDDAAIVTFLVNGVVDGIEKTTFKGIKRFPPGHYGIIDMKDRNSGIELRRYYTVGKNFVPDLFDATLSEIVGEFRQLFFDAVRIRLRSDVEVGVSLSGGLDSGSIYSVASMLGKTQMHSFSIYYPHRGFDESPFYNEVIKKFGGYNHQTTPDHNNFVKKYKKIIYYLDEPVKSMGVFSQWHVFQLARNFVTVMLGGQGGDELLAGYHPYFLPFMADIIKNFPYMAFSQLEKIHKVAGIPIKKFLSDFTGAVLGIGPVSESIFLSEIQELASNVSFYTRIPDHIEGFLNRRLFNDLTYLMLPNFLRYEDRISMAFSMESRLPFLDYRIVDFSFNMPFHLKIREGWTKWILREAMNGILPQKVRLRRDKKGFPTPFKMWIMDPDIMQYFRKPSILLKYVKPNAIETTMSCALEGNDSCVELLWRFLNLEIWHEVFFERKQETDFSCN